MTIAIFLGSLLAAMALGIPIAFSLLLCGAALMWHLDMFDAQILAQNVINGADSFPLLAVPFFMLAGEVMNTGGLSKRIVNIALATVGHGRGGLGCVAVLASCSMASLSGSAVADAAALSALRDEPDAMVFYEAPHRILECVADMAEIFGGEREILIAREMTKLHEQIVRMPLADTAAWFAADANRVRGEFVLVLAGAPAGEGLEAEALRVLDLLLAEWPVKSAASLAAEITGAPRKALYAQALLRRRED
mgnify:CR=1 FL=1